MITDNTSATTDEHGGDKVGAVSLERYQQLVARLLELDEQHMRAQFETGDAALEIAPMQPRGGSAALDPIFGVDASLQRLSDDTRIPVATLERRRWVASRWPEQHRRSGVSYAVHAILASIPDDTERWRRITEPPRNDRTGRSEWTEDGAKRIVGQKVNHPVSVTEKVRAIHDLAVDDQVASTIAADLLRRPDVAFQTMGDQVARDMVNRAQVDHAQQRFERNLPPAAARGITRLQQTSQFLDLVTACSVFTTAIGRGINNLRGYEFSSGERDTLHQQIAKVRATVDWLESAVDTGNLTLDEGLAAMLRGEH